jgi:hypothetical protein
MLLQSFPFPKTVRRCIGSHLGAILPALDRVQRTLSCKPEQAVVDGGYISGVLCGLCVSALKSPPQALADFPVTDCENNFKSIAVN